MDNLYQTALKSHYSKPIGLNRRICVTHCSDGYNASCGDEISITLQIRENIIDDIAFESDCCAICTASASIMCKISKQKDLTALELFYQQLLVALRPLADNIDTPHQELKILQPISQYPSRINCALLPWQTAIEAMNSPIDEYKGLTTNA